MATIIEARKPGTCGICHQRYEPGRRILRDEELGWVEADCKFPKRANTSPSSPRGGDTKPEANSVIEREIQARVETRLNRAKEIVDERFPDAHNYSDYLNMITEISHQLFAESTSERIQSAKERNIKAIKG